MNTYTSFLNDLINNQQTYKPSTGGEEPLFKQVERMVYGDDLLLDERAPGYISQPVEQIPPPNAAGPVMPYMEPDEEKGIMELLGAQGNTGFSERFRARPAPNMQGASDIRNIEGMIRGAGMPGQAPYQNFFNQGNPYIDQLIRGITS